MNIYSILLILAVTTIIFYPLFFTSKREENQVNESEKENLLETLRNIELEYELGNIDESTYLKSKSDYASKLKVILEDEKNA